MTDYVELKKIMVEKEIKTTKELSEKSGISRNTLAKVLDGKSQPSADVMLKLVSTLEIEPEKAGRIFLTTTYVLRKIHTPKEVIRDGICRRPSIHIGL